jgi:hypothetical protein
MLQKKPIYKAKVIDVASPILAKVVLTVAKCRHKDNDDEVAI